MRVPHTKALSRTVKNLRVRYFLALDATSSTVNHCRLRVVHCKREVTSKLHDKMLTVPKKKFKSVHADIFGENGLQTCKGKTYDIGSPQIDLLDGWSWWRFPRRQQQYYMNLFLMFGVVGLDSLKKYIRITKALF